MATKKTKRKLLALEKMVFFEKNGRAELLFPGQGIFVSRFKQLKVGSREYRSFNVLFPSVEFFEFLTLENFERKFKIINTDNK